MNLLLVVCLILESAVALPRSLRTVHYESGSSTQKPWELAQFELAPFELRHMCVECTKEGVGSIYACSIKFDWDDPNANQSCTCNESWQWNGNSQTRGFLGRSYDSSTEYTTCRKGAVELFQFKFVDIFDLSNFSLSLSHMYRDTNNFPEPTVVNMFAQPNISLRMMGKSNTSITYSPARDSPINANITGMTI
ncbi:hypothetical protein GGR52DRAFT_530351 [Hypoxylon sp. FL1284]|nr:hypothetical protein GGR52DRAFT_530351 [Hypoxylon sp. FL1284]